jgi:hypothetical protein
MKRPGRGTQRFVRQLLGGERAVQEGEVFRAGTSRLAVAEVEALASSGVLRLADGACVATPEAKAWLRRALVEADGFAAQHRVMAADGVRNLADSPLARLAQAAAGERSAFLEPHQVEAGERVRLWAEKARLSPRLTMSYSAAHVAGGSPGQRGGEIGDMAADASKRLNALWDLLPRDCAGVVMDVCVFEKGLQQIEAERGWPRRSAKLVLRIGLEQLAGQFRLAPLAAGPERGKQRGWMAGERVRMFG